MKKLLTSILCICLFLTLCTGAALAYTRDIGSYDTYTGMQGGMMVYLTPRDKYNANVDAVDNNESCEEVDFGETSYTAAVYIAYNGTYGSRVAGWTTVDSGERKILEYFSGRGTTSEDYLLGHNVGMFSWCKGTWCPDES